MFCTLTLFNIKHDWLIDLIDWLIIKCYFIIISINKSIIWISYIFKMWNQLITLYMNTLLLSTMILIIAITVITTNNTFFIVIKLFIVIAIIIQLFWWINSINYIHFHFFKSCINSLLNSAFKFHVTLSKVPNFAWIAQ